MLNLQVGRVTPCAPWFALGRAAGRGLPALPTITGSMGKDATPAAGKELRR